MATTNEAVKWQDLLENEFDKAYVNLDMLLNKHISANKELYTQMTQHLNAICSTFSQLNQKALTIFYNNAKLEAQLVSLRADLTDSTGSVTSQTESAAVAAPTAPTLLEGRLTRETAELRRYCLALQSELYGTRLAAKYLDKELAGRVQQLQLISSSSGGAKRLQQLLDTTERRRLWSQLEAEIRLHRCKAVLRACRGRSVARLLPPTAATGVVSCEPRQATVQKSAREGLGMSIAGGREQGMPILVSDLHAGQPAARSGQLVVGDAILSVNGVSLREVRHAEAARLLGDGLAGTREVQLVVACVAPLVEESAGSDVTDEEDEFLDLTTGYRFKMYDEDIVRARNPRGSNCLGGAAGKRQLEQPMRSQSLEVATQTNSADDSPIRGAVPDGSKSLQVSPSPTGIAAGAKSAAAGCCDLRTISSSGGDDRYFSVPDGLDKT